MTSVKHPAIGLGNLLGRSAKFVSERVGLQPNVASAKTKALKTRLGGAKVTAGVCPYCAVGCGTLIHSTGKTILDIEGNPASPINAGTLCPKGAAQYQMHVNPQRWTTGKYRAPHSTVWQDVTLDWMIDTVAARIKDTRDRTFVETDDQGRRVKRTMALASLGGATLDNEENYLISKLYRSLGAPFVENQARI